MEFEALGNSLPNIRLPVPNPGLLLLALMYLKS
jgi:hypothetical protein